MILEVLQWHSHDTPQYSTILNMTQHDIFFERSCHVDWRANEYLEQTPTILRKYVLWSAMVKSQELDWMVINPLIGIYIPTVRIPNVGWMTIYCSPYTRFWPRWQLLITVVVLMFFFVWGLVSSTTTSTHLLLASTRHSSTFAATWCNWHWLTSRAN